MDQPYWLCRLCDHRIDSWGEAREHLLRAHREETTQLLGQAMIPEMMLLEKRLEG